MSKQQIEQLLVKVWDQLDNALNALETGIATDTTEMEQNVQKICNDVTNLDPNEAKELQPKLEKLIITLTEISTKLQKRKDDIENEIVDMNKYQNAHNAYGNSSALVTKKPANTE
ncbi:hypothetical protein N9W34_06330 [Rickettsiales bacterium]|nr:hypothetical protein [Rickettsiales bacterium]